MIYIHQDGHIKIILKINQPKTEDVLDQDIEVCKKQIDSHNKYMYNISNGHLQTHNPHFLFVPIRANHGFHFPLDKEDENVENFNKIINIWKQKVSNKNNNVVHTTNTIGLRHRG